MNFIEKIVCILGVIALLVLFIFAVSLAIKYLILSPIANVHIDKNKNLLQWKCEETSLTRKARLYGDKSINEYILSYKVLDSELSNFDRIFGDNRYIYFERKEPFVFKSENEFKEFVSKFKTLGDVKKYYKEVDDIITWYEP